MADTVYNWLEIASSGKLEPIHGPRVLGYARWRKDGVKVPNELAQDRPAWSASVRDVVYSIGVVGSTRPG